MQKMMVGRIVHIRHILIVGLCMTAAMNEKLINEALLSYKIRVALAIGLILSLRGGHADRA